MQRALPSLNAEARAHLGASPPLLFQWKGHTRAVREILDYWRESGRWWAGELPRELCLVRTDGGLYLLTRAQAQGNWEAKPLD